MGMMAQEGSADRHAQTQERKQREDCVLAISTGLTIGIVIFAIIWIALAFWPARVAGRKGHSFLGYFILSLIFFPLALILAYAVEDRTRRP